MPAILHAITCVISLICARHVHVLECASARSCTAVVDPMSKDETREQEPSVEPALVDRRPGRAERVFIDTWFSPPFAIEGDPYPVHVRGSLPTPAWKFLGFELSQAVASSPSTPKPEPRSQASKLIRLELTPLGDPGEPGTLSAQMLKAFEATATIKGLSAGSYQLSLRSRDDARQGAARRFVVHPRGLLAALRTSGGITGRSRSMRVFDDGRVEVSDEISGETRKCALDAQQQRAFAEKLRELPIGSEPVPRTQGADLISYTLDWKSAQGLQELVRDDQTLQGPMLEVVHALQGFCAHSQAQSVGRHYVIDYFASTIQVRTSSTGVFSFFGHEHTIMARAFEGDVRVDAQDLEHAVVALSIQSPSLAVVDSRNEEDRPAIEREMHRNVLESERHPLIRFESSAVRRKPGSDDPREVLIVGELALHGVTRRIEVPATIEFSADQVRARGRLPLAQTQFGIKPTSIAGGTIQVADQVEIRFDLTARAQP